MNIKNYTAWLNNLARTLTSIQVTDKKGKMISPDQGFFELTEKTLHTLKTRTHMYFIGNGASATMASHIAADLCKNGRVKCQVLTDPAIATAVVNDCGGEEIFAEPLKVLGEPGDTLVAVSSSGASPNILKAIEVAKSIGMNIITFSAMKLNNPLRKTGDLNFYIPAEDYGFAESGHATIMHYWVDMFLQMTQENMKLSFNEWEKAYSRIA